VWSHKGPTLKGIRNWAPPGTQLFFPGLRSDTFWTGWYNVWSRISGGGDTEQWWNDDW
jgi:hypothetical protein